MLESCGLSIPREPCQPSLRSNNQFIVQRLTEDVRIGPHETVLVTMTSRDSAAQLADGECWFTPSVSLEAGCIRVPEGPISASVEGARQ